MVIADTCERKIQNSELVKIIIFDEADVLPYLKYV